MMERPGRGGCRRELFLAFDDASYVTGACYSRTAA
jgi:hypothetical protein